VPLERTRLLDLAAVIPREAAEIEDLMSRRQT
jgi:hypothetical protein